MKKEYIILVVLEIVFLGKTAFSCSVCGGGISDEKVTAYLLITGLLSALPIIMGILLFLLIRRINKIR